MRAFLHDLTTAREVNLPLPQASGKGLLWLHLDGQNEADLLWLAQESDLPPVALNALKAMETRPRSDMVDGGALINMRGLAVDPDEAPDPLVSIRFWAAKGRVISFCYRAPQALTPVIARFVNGVINDPGDLITAFSTEMSKELDVRVADLGDQLDDIEERLDSERARSTRRKVSRIRAMAISYRRFVVPQREALDRLGSTRCDWLDEEDHLHIRESADRYARMAEELEAVRERAAIVHDELTDLRGEQMEARALLISIVAMIFLPLTFITGLLGMNVKGIPYAEESWAFWGVVGVCVLLGLAVLGFFIRAQWVRGR
jgi:zinc transporter